MTITLNDELNKKIEIEIKLHINERLFKQGIISQEMYQKARDYITTH